MSFGVFAGCTSPSDDAEHAEDEAVAAPPPNDPVVFAASDETKTEIGVARWGYEPAADDGTSVFRGYDALNRRVVEYRRTIDDRDPGAVHVTSTLTGDRVSGSQRIDFVAGAETNGEIPVTMRVLEDTFEDGGAARSAIARLAADAEANAGGGGLASAGDNGGSLVGKTRPLDANQLVTSCNVTVECQTELVAQAVADAQGREICTGYNLLVKPAYQTTAATIATGGTGVLLAAIGSLALPVGKCFMAVRKGKAADAALAECKANAKSKGCT